MAVFVGVWVLYQNYQLYQCVKEGRLEQHPLFAKYVQGAGGGDGGGVRGGDAGRGGSSEAAGGRPGSTSISGALGGGGRV
jgi:hypothetical protein